MKTPGKRGSYICKDIAEAEKEIKRYVAFRTGRIGELLKATQRSERAGVWLSYAARKSGMQAIGRRAGKCLPHCRKHIPFGDLHHIA